MTQVEIAWTFIAIGLVVFVVTLLAVIFWPSKNQHRHTWAMWTNQDPTLSDYRSSVYQYRRCKTCGLYQKKSQGGLFSL